MILLDTTTRSLEFKLAGAVTTNQLPFVSCYVDIETAGFGVTGILSNNGLSNNATAVTVVAAPGASTSRQLKFLSVRNADTAAATVILQYNDNATVREIGRWTLDVNDTMQFIDNAGFSVIDSAGRIKMISSLNSHTALTDIGTNTHAQIDTHIANTSNPHSVTKVQIGLTNVTDDAQIAESIGNTKGDIITFTGPAAPVRLGVGTNGYVVMADSAEASGIKWAAPTGGGTPAFAWFFS